MVLFSILSNFQRDLFISVLTFIEIIFGYYILVIYSDNVQITRFVHGTRFFLRRNVWNSKIDHHNIQVMSSRLNVKSKIKKKFTLLYTILYSYISYITFTLIHIYYMVGKDLTWLITLQAQTPNPPSTAPPPHQQYVHFMDRLGGRGGCINRNRKRTPSRSHYALTRY